MKTLYYPCYWNSLFLLVELYPFQSVSVDFDETSFIFIRAERKQQLKIG
jgi:hypothetical protein